MSGAYAFRHDTFILSPCGRLALASTQRDAATETGAGIYNLVYFDQQVPTTKVSVGLRGESTVMPESGTMRPYFRIEYQRDFDNPGAARMAYADDTSTVYQVLGAGVARNALVFGLGSDFLFRRVWTLNGRYQYTNNSGAMTMHTLWPQPEAVVLSRGAGRGSAVKRPGCFPAFLVFTARRRPV